MSMSEATEFPLQRFRICLWKTEIAVSMSRESHPNTGTIALQTIRQSFAAATLTLLLFTGSVGAQSLAGIIARTGLTQDDLGIMSRTAASLYATGEARVGSDAIWSNPATRAFGMVEVVSVEGECVRLAYRFQTRRRPTTQEVVTRRCRVGDRWVLAE